MEYLDQIRPFLERLLPRAANANATDVLSTPPPPPVELPPSALGDNAIFVAYAALLAMAVAPIILGSRSSVDFKTEKGKGKGGKAVEEKEEEREFFRLEDAKMFPLIGSATLFGLYLLFTYFDKEYVNYLLTGYFAIIGVGAMVKMIMAVSRAISGKELKGEYRIDMWKGETEILSYHFSVYLLIVLALSTVLTVIYVMHKHWLLSNVYGLAFSTTAIQLLSLDSFMTGIILLSGLFFYDVFWVFFTPVMVTVAKSFDAPIKVIFPRDVGQIGWQGLFMAPPKGVQFTMLGLGDIVIPGIYIALCLRFDYANHLRRLKGKPSSKSPWSFSKPYFTACLIAYILGLVTTVVVMHTFQAAQPALLYLSPACILSTLATALIRGEWTQLFEYAEGQEEEGEGKEDKKDEKKDKKPVEKKAVKADKAAKAEKEKPADKSLSPEKMDKGKAVAKTGSHASLPATPAPGSPAQLNKRGRAKAKAEAGTATPARTEPSQPFKEVDVSVKEMAMFRFKNQGPSRN